jgi:hypothetical protein
LGPLSIGFPDPLNTRPSMSSETGMFRVLPVNSTRVFLASMPEVPSKTYDIQSCYIQSFHKGRCSTDHNKNSPEQRPSFLVLQELDQHACYHQARSVQRFQRTWGTVRERKRLTKYENIIGCILLSTRVFHESSSECINIEA